MKSRNKQIKIYTGKLFRLFLNDHGWKILLFAVLAAAAVSIVLQGTMFHYDFDTEMGFFTLISACIWIGIFNSIQSICKERPIIKREHRSGLHMSSFVLAHLVYQSVISFAEALIFLLVTAFFLPYPTGKSLTGYIYFEYFITYFLVILASDSLALAVSAIVHSTTTAMTVMPFILIFQLLFAGTLFTLEGPLETAADFTISRWGLKAACISCDYNELDRLQESEIQSQLKLIASSRGYSLTDEDAEQILSTAYEGINFSVPAYNYNLSNLISCWSALLLHTVCYIAICILFLEFIDHDKR